MKYGVLGRLYGSTIIVRNVADALGGGGNDGGAGNPLPPQEVTAPWAGSAEAWKIGEGEGAKLWYDFIPEEKAREHVQAKQYANPAELALANYNLTRLQRGDPNIAVVPDGDAGDDAWNEFYKKAGRPDAPENYDFKFGDDVQTDTTMVEWGKKAFHEVGLTQKQAQALADKWNEFATQADGSLAQDIAKQNEADLTALQASWGADLEVNKAAGLRVIKAAGLSDELLGKVEGAIGTAGVVELLAKIGRKSDEGGFTGGSANGDPNDPSRMTKEQAQAKITELQGNNEFMEKYRDSKHPGHKDALSMMEKLYARTT